MGNALCFLCNIETLMQSGFEGNSISASDSKKNFLIFSPVDEVTLYHTFTHHQDL